MGPMIGSSFLSFASMHHVISVNSAGRVQSRAPRCVDFSTFLAYFRYNSHHRSPFPLYCKTSIVSTTFPTSLFECQEAAVVRLAVWQEQLEPSSIRLCVPAAGKINGASWNTSLASNKSNCQPRCNYNQSK
eukprot:scaffold1893_cov220-Amphora_coffeaeformis.AAC.27